MRQLPHLMNELFIPRLLGNNIERRAFSVMRKTLVHELRLLAAISRLGGIELQPKGLNATGLAIALHCSSSASECLRFARFVNFKSWVGRPYLNSKGNKKACVTATAQLVP